MPFNADVDDFHEDPTLSFDSERAVFDGEQDGMAENAGMSMKGDEKLNENVPEFSEDEERQIMDIARVHLATYGRVIRSKIPEAMQPRRNNAMYPAVKYICDREGW